MSRAYELAYAKTDEQHQQLYAMIYELVKEALGDRPMEESIKWGQLMFHRGTENLIAPIPLKSRINLQFFNGAHLNNAHGLLEGTGKDLRHVKCHDAAFVQQNRAKLVALVDESVIVGA